MSAVEHEASHPALQHHFENLEQQREAASLGMWVFLVTEIMFFGGMFFAYTLYRTKYPAAFASASNHLSLPLGAINTAVLIFSSFTMALAVYSAQTGKRRNQVVCLALTILLGLTFL
ncbi:MAG: cytochrome c oxidase subunit 3, partial [bacterium]